MQISDLRASSREYDLYQHIVGRINIIELQFNLITRDGFQDNISEAKMSRLYEQKLISIMKLQEMKLALDTLSLIAHASGQSAGDSRHTYSSIRTEFMRLGSSESHCKRLFGVFIKRKKTKKPPFEAQYLKTLRTSGVQARCNTIKKLIEYEGRQRCYENWHLVFDTLTVEDKNLNVVFQKGSKAFKNYIRSVSRSIGRRIYGSVRKSDAAIRHGDCSHSYIAVIERGSQMGRLHIHVLHYCKVLPENCSDPNRKKGHPVNREIIGFKKFWKYGFSMPIACRFSSADAYGKMGWKWPVMQENKLYVSIPRSNVQQLSNYIGKYIVKAYHSNRSAKGNYLWRIRKSQKLGMKMITKALSNATSKMLEEILIHVETPIFKVRGKKIPHSLIRREAMKIYIKKMNRRSMSRTWKYLISQKPRPSIVEQLRSMMTKQWNPNWLNTGDSATLILNDKVTSRVCKLFDAAFLEVFGPHPISSFVVGG